MESLLSPPQSQFSVSESARFADGVRVVQDHERTSIAIGLAAALVILPGQFNAHPCQGSAIPSSHDTDASEKEAKKAQQFVLT